MSTSLLLLLLLLLLSLVTMLGLRRLQSYPIEALRHLLQLLRYQTLRRNHALEHATLNVFEERHGPSHLVGYALSDGFRIAGAIEPLELLDVAQEALRRLQRGEHQLAIHHRCGPSYLAAQVLVSAGALSFLLATHRLGLLDLPMIVAVAIVLAPGVSRLLQRFATTATDVQGIAIEGIGPLGQSLRNNLSVYDFIVRIRPKARRYEPPYHYGKVAPAYAPARTNNGHHRQMAVL